MHQYRTHNCNQISSKDIGNEVRVSGWLHSKRDHGELLFLDLRDHFGLTQIVLENGKFKDFDVFTKLKLESVLTVTGEVVKRSAETINKNLATGEVEIVANNINIESEALQIPFQINDNEHYPEDLRLKFRFLDLRREEMHNNIILRSKIISFLREKMTEKGFLEIQTPILTASSPEGARDFLVPSRLNPGKFYALPQAPQQFKQLLMTSGFDKYFQIAPCFRDEDARADRSPGEFYQLDLEMSFATQEDVFDNIEPVIHDCFKEFSNKKIITDKNNRFERIAYKESMLKYGVDKPDLRIPIEICDVTEDFIGSDFKIFTGNIDKGAVVRAIIAPKTHEKPRKFFDDMINYAISEGAGGLAYLIYNPDGTIKSPIAKLLGDERLKRIKEKVGASDGDTIFFACDQELEACHIAGRVRVKIAESLDLIDKNIFHFCWVTDFPYYEYDKELEKIDFSHNPFSMPQGGLEALETKDPLEILAFQYDLVCNGVELSSGAVRNHKPDLMYKAFEIAGYDKSAVDDDFSAMINAFKYGAPPHGGIAPGIDRMVMLIADTENIREVTAFPMNGNAQDLLMSAPNIVSEKQLRELNISLSPKVKKILEGKEDEQQEKNAS